MKAMLSVIKKEMRLIRSQRMSMALIIIYPLIVISALGLAYGGDIQAVRINVALYIPEEATLGPFDSAKIFSIIEDTNKVNLQRAYSEEQAKDFVRVGASDFALIIKEEKTQTGQIITDLVLDNSNFIVSEMFSPIAKAAIQLTSFEVSSRIIQELWDELLPIKDDLQQELQKIDLYLVDLDDAELKLDSLDLSLQNIDIADLRGTLDSQGETVQAISTVLMQLNSNYDSFKSDIAGTRTSLDNADAKLDSYHAKVSEQIRVAREYRDSLVSYENNLQEIADRPETPPSVRADILVLKEQVTSTRQRMDSSIAELEQIKADIEESKEMIADMRQDIDKIDSLLDSEKQNLDRMNSALGQSTGEISQINSELGSIGETVDEIDGLIDSSKITKQDVSSKMRTSKAMMNSFMSTIGELGQLNPAFLAKPIQAFERNLYEEITALTFITPMALALVLLLTCLLFVTVSVITEKSEGSHLRMRLSSTGPTTLIFGKIVGQMAFAFLVAFLILFIGVIGFGTAMQYNLPEIIAVVALASFSFIAIGLFITNFAKTQATAILSSLIVILPMIFLSGTVLPLQLMSPLLQTVSNFLPLTIANKILLGVLIKGVPISYYLKETAILLVPSIAMIAYTIKRF
ncbi:MAG: ABC transporter permease [Candidatus Diapherotrites archaeon]|uniref:ABC transporter permease n=1 Tax=Candidatus Iainarchaeum sp. TaxID=3101447 RepID=A0A938YWG8_9ARCH|nr:ABC transporter permease [Candidatus Diapherotrites archaeon]